MSEYQYLKHQINDVVKNRKEEAFKNLLRSMITTRMRTAFIYPLAQLEELFGELWGHDIDDKTQLDEDHLEWLSVYKQYRKAVLDNGNVQLRAILDELDNYKIEFKNDKVIFVNLRKDCRND